MKGRKEGKKDTKKGEEANMAKNTGKIRLFCCFVGSSVANDNNKPTNQQQQQQQ